MKGKLKIVLPLLVLLLAGGAYKTVLAKPHEAAHKVSGEVYVLPREFMVNLTDGRFAKVNVGLILAPGESSAAGGHAAASPPEGFGPLPQEAIVRDIVTDALSQSSSRQLLAGKARDRLKQRLSKAINQRTDVKVESVLLTDVTVQ